MVNVSRASLVCALLVMLTAMSIPLFGQIDLSGDWSPIIHEDAQDRTGGPDLGDYTGLPINDAARLRADSWEATMLSLPEWQCRPHPIGYITHGPSTLRISKEVSSVSRQVIAWHAEWLRSQDRPIYLDGRPHPSEDAPHTWMGFSTGKWEGDVLSIRTTHLKEGYIRRNGLPISDMTTMSEHLIRHGDYLSWVTIITDPVYLTEPLVRTQEYALNLRGQLNPNPCSASDIGQEVVRPKGSLPHHLPGTNPFLTEFATQHQLSLDAVRGGAETLYPEYQSKLSGASSGTKK